MGEEEFDVLDELYFVISYHDLHERLEMGEDRLKEVLMKLMEKGWMSVYQSMEEEAENIDISKKFRSYFYLASKKGLLAHNRQ